MLNSQATIESNSESRQTELARDRPPRTSLEQRSRLRRNLVLRLAALVPITLTALACGQGAASSEQEGVSRSAAVAPSLGTTQSFAVLAGSTVTNVGPTIVTGNLGVAPGLAVTGFPPGLVIGGTLETGTAAALQAQSDLTAAYVNLAGQACNVDLTGQDLGGLTLTPGTYCFSSSAQLTGTLTLDAQGDPAAVFVFQIGGALTTASSSSVLLTNGGKSCGVYWQVGSSATVGTGSALVGSVLALTNITLTTGASISGRALARNGAVTLDTNSVSRATCQAEAGAGGAGGAEAGTGGAAAGGAGGVAAGGAAAGGAAAGGAAATPRTPPSCALTAVLAGPPKTLQITVQDPDNGIASIQVTEANNATVSVPTFTPGNTGAFVVVATKVDPNSGSQVALRVTDVNGAVTDCDPVVRGEPVTSDVPAGQAEGGGCNIGGPYRKNTSVAALLAVLVGVSLLRRRRHARSPSPRAKGQLLA